MTFNFIELTHTLPAASARFSHIRGATTGNPGCLRPLSKRKSALCRSALSIGKRGSPNVYMRGRKIYGEFTPWPLFLSFPWRSMLIRLIGLQCNRTINTPTAFLRYINLKKQHLTVIFIKVLLCHFADWTSALEISSCTFAYMGESRAELWGGGFIVFFM